MHFSGCRYGAVLNREQDAAERLLAAFTGAGEDAYASLAALFAAKLRLKFTEKEYRAYRGQIKERFGLLEEAKFSAFEKFDSGDRVSYLAAFTKEGAVLFSVSFSKAGRVTRFSIAPLATGG